MGRPDEFASTSVLNTNCNTSRSAIVSQFTGLRLVTSKDEPAVKVTFAAADDEVVVVEVVEVVEVVLELLAELVAVLDEVVEDDDEVDEVIPELVVLLLVLLLVAGKVRKAYAPTAATIKITTIITAIATVLIALWFLSGILMDTRHEIPLFKNSASY